VSGPRAGSRIEIVLVAAVADNGVIGRGGALPWRLKSDMLRLRVLTWGKQRSEHRAGPDDEASFTTLTYERRAALDARADGGR